jgi:hypothetical protein
MAQSTVSAAQLARLASKDGRLVTGKTVRSWFRANVARFDDDAYTAHAYSAGEVRAYLAAHKASGERASVQPKGKVPKGKGTRSQASTAAVEASTDATA